MLPPSASFPIPCPFLKAQIKKNEMSQFLISFIFNNDYAIRFWLVKCRYSFLIECLRKIQENKTSSMRRKALYSVFEPFQLLPRMPKGVSRLKYPPVIMKIKHNFPPQMTLGAGGDQALKIAMGPQCYLWLLSYEHLPYNINIPVYLRL